MKSFPHLLAFLVWVATFQSYNCFDSYDGKNYALGTPGGDRFEKEIGLNNALYILRNSSDFFYHIFDQKYNGGDRKNIALITRNIQSMSGIVRTTFNFSSANSQIFMNSLYIGNYSGDVKFEFTGIMYHEIARIRQWDANGIAPFGLITGIADFFRLKSGYASVLWAKPGMGSEWDEGYDVTALFLDYCNNMHPDLVSKLNAMMMYGYSVDFFRQITGKTVDELWNDYKAQYGSQG